MNESKEASLFPLRRYVGRLGFSGATRTSQHLLGETPAEVNLHELLRIAQTEFKSVKTVDEDELKQDWPRLRAALGKAFLRWNDEFKLETGGSKLEVKASAPTANSKLPTAPVSNLPRWRQRFTEIAAGHGIAIVPQFFANTFGTRLKLRPLTPAPAPQEVGIVRALKGDVTPAGEKFCVQLRAAAKKLAR